MAMHASCMVSASASLYLCCWELRLTRASCHVGAMMCKSFAPFLLVPQGWQGAQTLPREITLDEASRALMMNPVKEVETLRTQLLYNSSALSLPADFSNGGLTVSLKFLHCNFHNERKCIVFFNASNALHISRWCLSVGSRRL